MSQVGLGAARETVDFLQSSSAVWFWGGSVLRELASVGLTGLRSERELDLDKGAVECPARQEGFDYFKNHFTFVECICLNLVSCFLCKY